MGTENPEGCSSWCLTGTPVRPIALCTAPLVCEERSWACGTVLLAVGDHTVFDSFSHPRSLKPPESRRQGALCLCYNRGQAGSATSV